MPIFKFRGYKNDGSGVSGTIEASGPADAVTRIKAEGIFPSNIVEPHRIYRKRFFRKKDETLIPHITRQLSMLLSSGVPLLDALQSLAAEQSVIYREMLVAVKEHVAGGSTLCRALEDFPDDFPEFYRSMVRAGEESGTLDKVLERLADFLEKKNAVRSKVRSSMIYPVIMLGVSFVVLSFLFAFVIPKIVTIFENTKNILPLSTRILISMSNLFIHYWWVMLGLAAVCYAVVRWFLRSYRPFVDTVKLRMFGRIVHSLYYARFSRTLGFLIEGGLPMLSALKLSAGSINNRVLEDAVLRAEEKVAQGQRLSASLETFSPVFIQLIATGERSGRLAESLKKAADAYENEFDRSVTNAVSVFEPLMIIGMALIVAFIVLAVLLPIFQLNQIIT
jgi:general secretion pathway protein F